MGTLITVCRILCLLATCGIVLRATAHAAAEGPPLEKETHTYKAVGETKVQADVSRRNGTEARPVVDGMQLYLGVERGW